MQPVASGTLRKMATRLEDPVQYKLRLGECQVSANSMLGNQIVLRHAGVINCIHCGRISKKSFNQGYCFPCFQKLAQCDSCIIHPEKCHYDQGSCREPEWGEEFCMQDHIVYLANSSGIKVGITRATQIPTRWIDQGATQALAIIRVRSRLHSGMLEVLLKQHVSDKTNWRIMLKSESAEVDLESVRDELLLACKPDIDELSEQLGFFGISVLNGIPPVTINYPIKQLPETITALSFEKQAEVSGTLLGIKGQYLILDSGVINLRRFAGYHVELFT